jgi:hypothetical protein
MQEKEMKTETETLPRRERLKVERDGGGRERGVEGGETGILCMHAS